MTVRRNLTLRLLPTELRSNIALSRHDPRLENRKWCQLVLERTEMRPPLTDYIGTEARFGARNYEPLGVVLPPSRDLG